VSDEQRVRVELLMDVVGYREDGETRYADRAEIAAAQAGVAFDAHALPDMTGGVFTELPESEVPRLENGRPITWLSRHLGHSLLAVTSETYGHWEAAERKREAAAMEGAFGNLAATPLVRAVAA
jgi:hypothetical protein